MTHNDSAQSHTRAADGDERMKNCILQCMQILTTSTLSTRVFIVWSLIFCPVQSALWLVRSDCCLLVFWGSTSPLLWGRCLTARLREKNLQPACAAARLYIPEAKDESFAKDNKARAGVFSDSL